MGNFLTCCVVVASWRRTLPVAVKILDGHSNMEHAGRLHRTFIWHWLFCGTKRREFTISVRGTSATSGVSMSSCVTPPTAARSLVLSPLQTVVFRVLLCTALTHYINLAWLLGKEIIRIYRNFSKNVWRDLIQTVKLHVSSSYASCVMCVCVC
jgi:hypothetical protein